jgi:type IV pilus assembly protein PilA
VVVLILAILMAVALPLYLSAIANSERRTCRANMQTIAHAERAYKVRTTPHVYVAISEGADMVTAGLTDLQSNPKCPNAGKYSVKLDEVGTGTLTVHCSIAAHGQYTPGVDAE